jgi:hypothetical protein
MHSGLVASVARFLGQGCCSVVVPGGPSACRPTRPPCAVLKASTCRATCHHWGALALINLGQGQGAELVEGVQGLWAHQDVRVAAVAASGATHAAAAAADLHLKLCPRLWVQLHPAAALAVHEGKHGVS